MNYKRLFFSLFFPQLAGWLGAIFTTSAIPVWYAALEKPSFSPPNWLFGPVWFLLYVLMGLSVYLIWQKADRNKKARSAMSLFWIHLFFNFSWSYVFFGLKWIGLALVNILIIWAFIVILMKKFSPIDKRAAYLLAPYFLWVSFATVLNAAVWWLN